ncbi:MAG TPA: hypothetical protein VEV84_15285, partial [Pyrinomonadaceae bacterium]|nr:hypothetical protein [Pyrinomonadaceae bacterium]
GTSTELNANEGDCILIITIRLAEILETTIVDQLSKVPPRIRHVLGNRRLGRTVFAVERIRKTR